MASPSGSPSLAHRRISTPPTDAVPIPDVETYEDLPMTMSASVVLTSLPRDATAALAAVGAFEKAKVTVRFKAVGSAPILARQVCKITATQRFEAVVGYLRKVLKCGPNDSVFLYVNSVFAPALDEVVGNLHRCFRTQADDQLVVAYSMTPAFG